MEEKVKVTNECPICGRLTHKESKYCIFHASAEEKTEEDFKRKLKKYVGKIKEKDDKYDFDRFIFIGDINFNEDLNITIFENANFRKTTFNGCANFKGATFEAGAYFTWATFNGPAFFSNSTFKAGANFTGATFNGPAFFSRATFKTGSTFTGTTFKEHAYFTFTSFNGHATFDEATFKGDVSFYLKNLLTYLNLNETKVFPGKKLSINVNNGKNNIIFQHAYLENACLNLKLCEDVFIDLTDTLLKNTKIKKDQIKSHILQEKEKKFSEAKEIYLFLKNNFHSIGRYDDESWAFTKERDMERKSNFHFKTLHKWLWSCLLNGIFGYGEQPGKVIVSAILVILLFASLFTIFGISNVGIEFSTSNNFLDCMYFSTITFTTLGYGDFRPLEGVGRILAGSEAFIGAFMMALFVYTFARRTGGR